MAYKTKLMLRIEAEFHSPLETLLPQLVNQIGLSPTAQTLGISKATLGYWLLKLRIETRRVALAPGQTLSIRPPHE